MFQTQVYDAVNDIGLLVNIYLGKHCLLQYISN